MTPLKDIGECLIIDGQTDYFFRPSFSAMSAIGEPGEIVQALHDLHNDEVTQLLKRGLEAYGNAPGWLLTYARKPQLSKPPAYAAMNVLRACCEHDITPLIGELVPGRTGKWAFVYRPGHMSLPEMVLIAQSLITHGIIGKAKVRRLQRYEGGQATSEFKALEYISAARNHFGMSRAEAEQLTMTEFQLLLAAKYPDQKGFTKEEYDDVADVYLAKKARRLAKKQT